MWDLSKRQNEVKEKALWAHGEEYSRKKEHVWCVWGDSYDWRDLERVVRDVIRNVTGAQAMKSFGVGTLDFLRCKIGSHQQVLRWWDVLNTLHSGELPGAPWIGCRDQGWVQGDQLWDLSKRAFGFHSRWVFWVRRARAWVRGVLGLRLRVMWLFSGADAKNQLSYSLQIFYKA